MIGGMGRMLMVLGGILFLLGLLLSVGGRFGLGRLPGDFAMQRGNFSFYFPLGTSILLSVVLSLLLMFVGRFFR